jgi:hypothetical protein
MPTFMPTQSLPWEGQGRRPLLIAARAVPFPQVVSTALAAQTAPSANGYLRSNTSISPIDGSAANMHSA